jgi:hypothetical protein
MAQEVVGLQIKVGTEGFDNIKALRKGLKEANDELIKAQTNFGAYSEQARIAGDRVAQLKDTIKEAGEVAELFDPGKKFQVYAGALSAVAGGFTAVQGAVGLLGVKSEEVEKSILKVQSALALTQGLNVIADSAKNFQRLIIEIKSATLFQKANNAVTVIAAKVTKAFGLAVDTTATSFKVLKGAIAATGIGLLVVAIGELVSAFQNYQSAAEKAKLAQEELNKSISDGAKIALEAEQQFLDNEQQLAIARAKNIGATEKEIFEIEQSFRKSKAEALIRYWKNVKDSDVKGALEAQKAIEKINIEGSVAELNFKTSQNQKSQEQKKKDNEKAKADAKQQAKELDDLEKERNERASQAQRVQTEAFKATLDERARQLFEIEEKYEEKRSTLLRAGITDFALIEREKLTAIENVQKEFLEREARLLEERIKLTAEQDRKDEETFEFYKELSKKQKEEEQKNLDARLTAQLDYANAVGKIFGNLAGLFEEGTAASKAAALAEIAIGTGTGFIQALDIAQKGAKATGPAAPFAFPIFYASQIAAVIGAASRAKSILSAAKGGGAAPVGSVNTSAPISPKVIPQASLTQLSSQSINELGSATNRAFVVESDITNSQERITRINRAARLA